MFEASHPSAISNLPFTTAQRYLVQNHEASISGLLSMAIFGCHFVDHRWMMMMMMMMVVVVVVVDSPLADVF